MIRSWIITRKVLLSAVGVAAAAGIAGLGSYAAFTSSTNASNAIASGTVTIGLGATAAGTNRHTVNAAGLVPGDAIQRSVDLHNSGDRLAAVTLTTTASPTSLLDTDATNGLQMVIDRCSAAWTEAGTAPASTYTCSGTTSTVLASRAVLGSTLALSNLTSTAAGATDHLRVTLSLPSGTPNTFQALSSTIQYTFKARPVRSP